MQNKFDLVETLPPYVFAAIHKLKLEAQEQGTKIIDFGMGNPDLSPPQHVMDLLSNLVKDPNLFGYSISGGIDLLKKAHVGYYQRRFGVELDQKTESLVTIGAKEGITSLATAISDDENYICVPSPSYPIHTFAFTIAKTKTHHIDAISGSDFLAKFKVYVEKTSKKPRAVLVSFPCNPTSEIVGLDFYEELVNFCKKHQIYIISDVAYAELYFNEEDKPHSILEVKGAKDIAIEFTSVSKSYSMAGCRVGFAAGNKDLIAALAKVKSFLDYGSFDPIQIAAAEALGEDSDQYLAELRKTYKNRADFMVNLLHKELGWEVDNPKASMFIWTKLPKKFANLTSFEFCKKMIFEAGVALSPGSAFGKNGEGFVRLSLIHDEENMKKAISKLKTVFND